MLRARQIIAQKERDGRDTSTSRKLLGQFEEIYRTHVADCDRLGKDLGEGFNYLRLTP